MDFREVVRRRRMVRSYDPAFEIPRELLERIVATVRRTPSAGFTQGQSFVVVTDRKVIDQVAEIAGQRAYREKGLPPWISSASAHVVVCTSAEAYGSRYREPDKAGTAGARGEWPVAWWDWDAGAAFMMLLLAAVDAGLNAGFMAFKTEHLAPIRHLLAIPPEVHPVGIVTLGKAAGDQPVGSAGRGRKPADEVVHWENW